MKGDSVTIADRKIVNQIRNVLRLKAGDHIIILDGEGGLLDCALRSVEKQNVECTVIGKRLATGDASARVTVALPLVKGDHFDWALQKLTELGVYRIRPMTTARTVIKAVGSDDAKKPLGTISPKLARWQAIVREASEQCERATIPNIVEPEKFGELIDTLTAGGTDSTVFICVERQPVPLLKSVLLSGSKKYTSDRKSEHKDISIVIGPEGGFTTQEIDFAIDRGCEPVSLGSRILRTETAAIYALAQILWCLEKY